MNEVPELDTEADELTGPLYDERTGVDTLLVDKLLEDPVDEIDEALLCVEVVPLEEPADTTALVDSDVVAEVVEVAPPSGG